MLVVLLRLPPLGRVHCTLGNRQPRCFNSPEPCNMRYQSSHHHAVCEPERVWAQVTLGIWQATGAQDIIGKVFGVYFPVLAFVAIGGRPIHVSCQQRLHDC